MFIRRSYLLIFSLFLFCSPLFAQSSDNSSKHRDTRQLGDIFLGFKIGSGITNFMNHTSYSSSDTRLSDKGMYLYNLSFMAEFYFTSYSALVLDVGLHNLRFDRKSTWANGVGGSTSSERPYEQWFNRFTLGARFLFWNIFYLQSGPSILVNYNSAALIKFMGVQPDINDSPGVSLQWQLGLGASTVIGYKENGDPFMTIDAAFFAYIPVAGYIVDGHSSVNAGGSPLHVKGNPYQFELALAFMFLV